MHPLKVRKLLQISTRLLHQHRHFCVGKSSRHQVCIVGSGPAGFYTAQHLLKNNPSLTVDIIEKLPVPFGLVRFGVAPDHPEVKNVINTFNLVANEKRFSFMGNVTVGEDISVSQLCEAYDAVIMAYGSPDDRKLGIPGEDAGNVLSARSFVGWYNGLPENKDLEVDLETDTAIVLGQGNVAIDVARILLSPLSLLQRTDITHEALFELRESRVKKVHLVGRRGPLQVAFTTAELREMTKLPECKTVCDTSYFEGVKEALKEIPRPRKRLTELLLKAASGEIPVYGDIKKEWHIEFLRSPQEIITENGRVTAVKFGINRLEGPIGEKQTAVPTGETEIIPCGLVFRSIGYQSVSIDPDLPFDNTRHIIPNEKGKVTGYPGLYCSGWVKRGPVGVIVSTMNDAVETSSTVLSDIKTGNLSTDANKGGRKMVQDIVEDKRVVSFEDWQTINEQEVVQGIPRGKPREKFRTVEEMLAVLS